MTARAKTRRAQRMAAWSVGAALAALCAPAAAQDVRLPPGFGSGNGTIYREDPASALSRYLRIITASPRNLEALTGAGRAALEVGDPQAAIGFYARAEAIAPKNGRVKAGLGSALVLLNQEQAALRYFDDATDLGVPEADIASDRGLAYDLRGSAKRAQRDYAIALRRGEDAETTRRMALSLAISGEREAALTLLDPLLRRQDTAAWRARAFILAMTGDTAGASRAAESVMPASAAAGFVPFFRKLPTLRPGEKAAAVHFGLFPGEGRPMRIDDLFNQAEVAARVALENTPRSATDAGTIDGSQTALGRLASRTPDGEGQVAARLASRPPAEQRAPVASTPRPNAIRAPAPRSVARGAGTPSPAPAPRQATQVANRAAVTPAPAPAPASLPAPAPAPAPVVSSPVAGRAPTAAPVVSAGTNVSNTASSSAPVPGFSTTRTPVFPPPRPAPLTATASGAEPATRLADISATVREAASEPLVKPVELPASSVPVLPDAGSAAATMRAPAAATRLADVGAVLGQTAAASGPPPAPKPKVETPTSTLKVDATSSVPPPSKPKVEDTAPRVAASKPKVEAPPKVDAKPDTDPGGDARIWVQIAGGADEKAFPAEWKRLKAKAPELLNPQTAWTTPLKATNRLLVGPFATDKEAQDFVNKLKPKGITAFAWTSAKGQAIARVAAR